MKQRFRLYRRKSVGRYYAQDNLTAQQASLRTTNHAEAVRLVHAKNEAEQQPALSVQIARAYLIAADPVIATRTWQAAMDALVAGKQGSSRQRYERAFKEQPLDNLRALPLLRTRPEHFLQVLSVGGVSTNTYLRRLHNFVLAISWLPWPILSKQQWPPVRHGEKRGITWEEHQAIVAAEQNLERRAFYELAWHVGAAQIDLASLRAEDVDWEGRVIRYRRRKTGTLCVLRFGEEVAAILRRLPRSGSLFPEWSRISSSDRAARFARRCRRLGIRGVSLHSYRYAWAERARKAGYPERFAQEALGHKSQAVHRAYARNAQVVLPALEVFEKQAREQNVIPFPNAQ